MLINELFNQIAPYKKKGQNKYKFEINGKQFGATFNFNPDYGWEFEFFQMKKNGEITMGVTGKMGKDAIKVFGTVRAIVADWIAHSGNAKDGIFFAAKSSDGARSRIYSRFIKELERKGWSTLEEPAPKDSEWVGYQIYFAHPDPIYYSE